MSRYVENPKGFDICFDGDVRREGITRNTFQATIVHHTGPDQPRRSEIAPAQIEIIDPRHIRLHLDKGYADHHLDGRNFDLFITLKCDLVVDAQGTPVDGDLLACLQKEGHVYSVNAPTGDGVPGGLFESWIRVHSS
jgi:hypothetical protein